MAIINYTTASIPLTVEGVDLSSQDVYVTLEQGSIELTKTGLDLIITTETHGQETDTDIVFTLTQAETAMFNHDKSVMIMVNWINESGTRDATEIKNISVMRNLLDRVITYGN